MARIPEKAAGAEVILLVLPMADSRSRTRVFGSRPQRTMKGYIPAGTSPACRDEIMVAVMNRAYPRTITNTGSTPPR